MPRDDFRLVGLAGESGAPGVGLGAEAPSNTALEDEGGGVPGDGAASAPPVALKALLLLPG